MSYKTKAEGFYFHPDKVVEFGIPERCANCPGINHDLEQRRISEAMTGDVSEDTLSGKYLLDERLEEEQKLKGMAEGCPGHEELSGDELDDYIATHREEDDLDRESVVVGYRCRSTGDAVIAISWGNGWVGIRPYETSVEEVSTI